MTDKSIESQGVIIAVGTTDSPSAYNTIGEITGFNGPGGSASVIDSTTLASTAKEKKMGLPDEGQFTLDAYLDNTDTTGQVALRTARTNRTLQYIRLTLTDSPASVAKFAGYVTGFSVQGSVDNLIKASITIEITGPVTWS